MVPCGGDFQREGMKEAEGAGEVTGQGKPEPPHHLRTEQRVRRFVSRQAALTIIDKVVYCRLICSILSPGDVEFDCLDAFVCSSFQATRPLGLGCGRGEFPGPPRCVWGWQRFRHRRWWERRWWRRGRWRQWECSFHQSCFALEVDGGGATWEYQRVRRQLYAGCAGVP
jgi:hypothetical protein